MDTRPLPIGATGTFRAAAWMGFLGVALGAFGAHALKDFLLRREMTQIWEKAVWYHFVHALAMLLLACLRPFPAVAWSLFGVGTLCFSGSLYAWALSGEHWLVFVTPMGGILLLAGWVALAVGGRRVAASVEEGPV